MSVTEEGAEPQPLNVYLCGGHSTGKTTLQAAVGRVVRLAPVAEVARGVIGRLGLARDDFRPDKRPEVFERLQLEIMRAHADAERENRQKRRDCIYDRCIDPVVYAETFVGPEAAERLLVEPVTQECIERWRQSLVFVLLPHAECFKDDGVRLPPNMPELRAFTDNLLKLLGRLGVRHFVIDVLDINARVNCIVKRIIEANRNDLIYASE